MRDENKTEQQLTGKLAELQQRTTGLEETETERRRAKHACRTLIEDSPLGLLIFQDARLVYANPAIVKLSAYTLEELMSFSLDDMGAIVQPEDQQRWQNMLERLDGRPGPPQEEFRFIRRDGTEHRVDILSSRIQYQGKPAVQLAVIDIWANTERKQAEIAAEEERERIAREMHDGLAQDLAALLLAVQRSLSLIDTDPVRVKERLFKMEAALQYNIREVRRLIFALRPLDLEELGFPSALRKLAGEFETRGALIVHLSGVEHTPRLGRELEFVLFRVVQESLNNAQKHAQANNVWIDLDLDFPHVVSVTIRDDGRGFDLDEAMREALSRGRLGLSYMQERVEAMRGKLVIDTTPTSGTKVVVTLPINIPVRNS